MNLFLRMLGGFAAFVVAIVAAWIFVPPLRLGPVCAPVEAWAIDHGWIGVKTADWGYLKRHSGEYGRKALRDLERKGSTAEIRRTAVAVQLQKGTRFDDLRLPSDAKTLPGAGAIPTDFWPDWQYRAECLMPPPGAHEQDSCALRMIDLTGDGQPEIVAERKIVTYPRQTVSYVWQIYVRKGGHWRQGPSLHFWPADPATNNTAPPQVSSSAFDSLHVDGRELNFFSDTMWDKTDNTVADPRDRVADLPSEAVRMLRVPVLYPYQGYVPTEFFAALRNRAISLGPVYNPQSDAGAHPKYAGLPPCFASHDILDCDAIVADIDHDGHQDVVIVSREILPGAGGRRMATLMMMQRGRWQVVANRPVCMPANLYGAKIKVAPSGWHAILFAGRTYVPDDGTDDCEAAPRLSVEE